MRTYVYVYLCSKCNSTCSADILIAKKLYIRKNHTVLCVRACVCVYDITFVPLPVIYFQHFFFRTLLIDLNDLLIFANENTKNTQTIVTAKIYLYIFLNLVFVFYNHFN